MTKGKKTIIVIASVVLAVILALVGTFFILTYIGKSQFHKEDTHISADTITVEDDTTITFEGKKYALNKDVISVLVMGVDRENLEENYGSGNNGQADVIFVATIDTKTKKTCIIPLSRETMVDVNLYTVEGEFAGTTREQLCLAYAYGNSTEESSQNVLTSVKRLLYGINISSYVTIEMEGVQKLTDMVGGIQLTSLEKIETLRLFAEKGEKLNLNGKQATAYIQYRGNDTEANARRMQRQKQFLSALMNQTGNAVLSDFTNLGKYYNTLNPYFYTNVSFAQITYLAQSCLTANFGDSIDYKTIDGTLTQGEKWIEFTANEDSILQTIIDVFYIEQN